MCAYGDVAWVYMSVVCGDGETTTANMSSVEDGRAARDAKRKQKARRAEAKAKKSEDDGDEEEEEEIRKKR